MSLVSGERQVAPTADGIRRDHVARYQWALGHLAPKSKVLDMACGVGYGSDILASAGHIVVGVDNNREAISYAREHYADNGAMFKQLDAKDIQLKGFDAVICFETIEHIEDPRSLLRAFRKAAPKLISSVPNESVFPFRNYKFHFRHYHRHEFADLLEACGWAPTSWHGQAGSESEVEADIEGRTLIAISEHGAFSGKDAPAHVAIVGLGPSAAIFSELTKRLGGNSAYCDEVWGLNAIGDVLACDRIFHMDDMRIQEARAELRPDSNIARMVQWLKKHPGPVYTSIVRDGYPGMTAFPLEDVLNGGYDSNGGAPYFNSTAAYAIAYAVHIGVKRISLFGIDYTFANAHQAEQGRACCEFWLGIAAARGIEITIPEQSTLMDACAPARERLYGYDCVDIAFSERGDGGLAVTMTERDRADIPTAEEIERRYDHKRHPNRIVQQEQET